jgi:hypothetical protein
MDFLSSHRLHSNPGQDGLGSNAFITQAAAGRIGNLEACPMFKVELTTFGT